MNSVANPFPFLISMLGRTFEPPFIPVYLDSSLHSLVLITPSAAVVFSTNPADLIKQTLIDLTLQCTYNSSIVSIPLNSI